MKRPKKSKKSSSQGKSKILPLVIIGLVIVGGLIVISVVSGAFKFNVNIGKNLGTVTEKLSGGTTYSNPDFGLTMKIPTSFVEDAEVNPSVTTTFMTKKQSTNDNFVENVLLNVAYAGSQKDLSLDQVYDSWLSTNRKDLPGMEVSSEETIEIAGSQAKKVNYSFADERGEFIGEAVLLLHDQKLVELIYSGVSSDFDTFHDDFITMYESLQFKPVELDWETFESENGFSLKHPKGWVVTDKSDDQHREVSVTHPKNFANLVIAAHKDETLNSKETMSAAIESRKKFLNSNADIKIVKVDDQVNETTGGWMINATKTAGQDVWQLHERGLVDVYGKVLLMQVGFSGIYGGKYQQALVEMMDSFQVK